MKALLNRLINQESISSDEAKNVLKSYKGQDIDLTVKRGEEFVEIPVSVSEAGTLGVIFGGLSYNDLDRLGYYELETKSYSFLIFYIFM